MLCTRPQAPSPRFAMSQKRPGERSFSFTRLLYRSGCRDAFGKELKVIAGFYYTASVKDGQPSKHKVFFPSEPAFSPRPMRSVRKKKHWFPCYDCTNHLRGGHADNRRKIESWSRVSICTLSSPPSFSVVLGLEPCASIPLGKLQQRWRRERGFSDVQVDDPVCQMELVYSAIWGSEKPIRRWLFVLACYNIVGREGFL